MIAVLLGSSAFAQVAPAIDAQVFRPTLDGTRFTWVDDARPANPGPFFGVTAGYARDPLLYVVHDVWSPVVHDLVQTDLAAGWAVGPVRLGAVIPVVARSTGWTGGESGLGDIAAAGRATFHTAAVDFGFDGRLWLPTTTVLAPVGDRRPSGELAVVASREFGRVLLAMNTGYRAVPRQILDGIAIDDVLTARTGVSFGLGERAGLSSELAGQAVVRGLDLATTPVEALLGGYVDPEGPLGVKLAVGRGLGRAIGAPTVRAVLGVTWSSGVRSPDDQDRDGLVDTADRCPREPEDPDGWQDEDGCAERPWLVVRVVDEQGRALSGVQAQLVGRSTNRAFGGALEVELDPGAYTVTARQPGFADGLVAMTLTDGPPRTLDVVLHPQRVTVTHERVELDGVITFETASDRLLPQSWQLLDEVADVLLSTPEIRRLRIEGHTDSRGTDEENEALSRRRALAVRSYLLERGVAGSRLVSIGHGEAQPLVTGEDEAALARNRRVEFVVELWQ